MSDAVVEYDTDGLVRRRPDRWDHDTDTAMLNSFYDVALLDPVELADGHDGGPGATIVDLRVVDHHGRETWEATLRPTAVYDPRCPCCALLLSELIEDAGFDLRADDPSFAYPDAHRVRLDVGTGVCVANEQLGGSTFQTLVGRPLEFVPVDLIGRVVAILEQGERQGDRGTARCFARGLQRSCRRSSESVEANRRLLASIAQREDL